MLCPSKAEEGYKEQPFEFGNNVQHHISDHVSSSKDISGCEWNRMSRACSVLEKGPGDAHSTSIGGQGMKSIWSQFGRQGKLRECGHPALLIPRLKVCVRAVFCRCGCIEW